MCREREDRERGGGDAPEPRHGRRATRFGVSDSCGTEKATTGSGARDIDARATRCRGEQSTTARADGQSLSDELSHASTRGVVTGRRRERRVLGSVRRATTFQIWRVPYLGLFSFSNVPSLRPALTHASPVEDGRRARERVRD
jgi:hypothetical protein